MNSPLQPLSSPLFEEKGIKLYVKRDDMIHPAISGNKWRKLIYNIKEAKRLGHDTLLTFGGAYSNHIYAVAAAGQKWGFKTIAVIRGEEHLPLNKTLAYATTHGMQLTYLDRSQFKIVQSGSVEEKEQLIKTYKEQYGDFYTVPMGGSNGFALKGMVDAVQEIREEGLSFDYLTTACGTGGTMAGIIAALKDEEKVIGFPALKGAEFLWKDMRNLLEEYLALEHLPPTLLDEKLQKATLQLEYHFGGYAKKKPEQMAFIEDFEKEFNIPLEFIYTSKMFYGLFDLIKNDYFSKGTTIVAFHTGGLQVNE